MKSVKIQEFILVIIFVIFPQKWKFWNFSEFSLKYYLWVRLINKIIIIRYVCWLFWWGIIVQMTRMTVSGETIAIKALIITVRVMSVVWTQFIKTLVRLKLQIRISRKKKSFIWPLECSRTCSSFSECYKANDPGIHGPDRIVQLSGPWIRRRMFERTVPILKRLFRMWNLLVSILVDLVIWTAVSVVVLFAVDFL